MTLNTQQIIAAQRATEIHASKATPEGWVSSRSVWSHDEWYLDAPASRMRESHCTIKWVGLSAPVANVLKVLFWSLLVSRPHGRKPIEVSSAASTSVRLQHLGRWMMAHGHRSLRTLTAAAVQGFRDELKLEIRARERDREDDLAPNTVASWLMPFQYAYEQGRHFEALGLSPMPGEPFPDSSARAAAEEITADVERFVAPLPDAVALPIVRKAILYLGRRGEDILRLQEACLKHRTGRGDKSNERVNRRIRDELTTFRFGNCEQTGKAWHAPLAAHWKEGTRDTPFYEVRRLLCDLLAACTIIVRFNSGIRSGELFTLKPGRRADGTAECVTKEQSLSGAYSLFFVNGLVSKGWDHETDTKWLIASRPSDSADVPHALQALAMLDRLAAPWREWSDAPEVKSALLVQFGFRGIARDPALILPLASDTMGELVKDFIAREVDLSHLDPEDETLANYAKTRGRCVQGKQWRKTYANFMIRQDRALLPAISQQFQHASTAITEVGYIGKDPVQLGLVESASMERALTYISAAMDGGAAAGRVSDALHDGLSDLKAKVAGISGTEKADRIRTWFVERDIRIFFASHGKCFSALLPSESRCHAEAGTLDWANQTPNFAFRNPRLCSGCKCFGVDAEDIPFWAGRYVDNERIYEEAKGRGMQAHYVVARERAEQSARFLRSLGISPETLTGGADGAQG